MAMGDDAMAKKKSKGVTGGLPDPERYPEETKIRRHETGLKRMDVKTMKTVKLKVIKDFEDGELKFKKNQIIDVDEKHHTVYIKMGVAELTEEKKQTMEVTKYEAIKLNKELAKLRKTQKKVKEKTKKVEEKEIEKIMEEKQLDREQAWRIYQQRKEQKETEKIWKKQEEKKLLKANKDLKETKKVEKNNNPKLILDKWATYILRKNAIWEKNGVSIVNQNKGEDYQPDRYAEDIVLWIPPKNCIRLEFEHEDYNTNLRCIRECENAAKTLGFNYCISEHKGGKSPYFNMFNIKNIPVNEDNPLAKNLLIDLILSDAVKEGLDRSNLGWTFSPVIGHPHWKKKYNGAIHTIIRGINPLEHENEYPKELLKQIKKSKTQHKYNTIQVQQNYPWVIDFLVDYCTQNKLPIGNRNRIIEKNLAVLIIHRKDRDRIMEKYFEVQERKHNSIKGWFNKVIKGEIKQVSPLELKKYIEENNIDYAIPTVPSGTATVPAKISVLTPEEHQILTDPKLLDTIVEEIQGKRVVGEKETIKCIFIVTNCRLAKNIKPTSSNINVNDESGLGKDWIVKAVLDILPDNVVVYRTKITPELLTYWHNSKYEPDWTWNGKILYIEDISTTLLNSDVFKVFSSGGSKATVLIKQYPVDIIINGKPSMIVTSYHINPNNENLRRYPICFCDSSEEQTLGIMKRQSIEDATGEIYSYNPELMNAIGKLKRVSVVIPFAEKLPYFFPKNHFMRTHYKRFLDYIKSSAALHQYQRERDENGNIIAIGED